MIGQAMFVLTSPQQKKANASSSRTSTANVSTSSRSWRKTGGEPTGWQWNKQRRSRRSWRDVLVLLDHLVRQLLRSRGNREWSASQKTTWVMKKTLKRSSGVVGPSCSAEVAVKSRKWRAKRIAEDNMSDEEDAKEMFWCCWTILFGGCWC